MPHRCQRSENELESILALGGLFLAEPYDASKSYPKNAYILTECKKCHVEAHYTLKYIMEKSATSEPVCRACFWRDWYESAGDPSRKAIAYVTQLASQADSNGQTRIAESLRAQDPVSLIRSALAESVRTGDKERARFLRDLCPPGPLTEEQARKEAADSGYDLVSLLDQDRPGRELLVVRCRLCRRQTVERRCDLTWGYGCRAHPNTPTLYAPGESHLLCESGAPCLSWWAHDRNDESTFEAMRTHAQKTAIWRCPKCGHVFEAQVLEMTGPSGPRCPRCVQERHSRADEEVEHFKHAAVADVPELMSAWDDERNPRDVMVWPTVRKGMCPGDGLYRFKCEHGHHAQSFPYTYLKEGCPFCKAEKTKAQGPFLADSSPELTAEWDQLKNDNWTPENLRLSSKRKAWWRCLACGHEWKASPNERSKVRGQACPECGKILGSLAWSFPSLAQEWDPGNPVSAWKVRPHSNPLFKPKWICANDPTHRWAATLSSRVSGAGCPECVDSGKSRVELRHFIAAQEIFGNARSGARVDGPTLSRTWSVDILVSYRGQQVAIEYDGAHWHEDGIETDTRKSLELLRAGYIVIRLREDDLPTLDIPGPMYSEVRVSSQSPRPRHVIEKVRKLLDTRF